MTLNIDLIFVNNFRIDQKTLKEPGLYFLDSRLTYDCGSLVFIYILFC